MACASSQTQPEEDPSALVIIDGVNYAPVEFDRQTHFVSTAQDDVVLEPGRYLVEVTGIPPLELHTEAGDERWAIDAVAGTHGEDLDAAVAESIPGEPDDPHLVLFLPDGKTLDAAGTYSGVVERGDDPRRRNRRRPERGYTNATRPSPVAKENAAPSPKQKRKPMSRPTTASTELPRIPDPNAWATEDPKATYGRSFCNNYVNKGTHLTNEACQAVCEDQSSCTAFQNDLRFGDTGFCHVCEKCRDEGDCTYYGSSASTYVTHFKPE